MVSVVEPAMQQHGRVGLQSMGAKDVGFLSNGTSGRANIPTKYTKNDMYNYTPWAPQILHFCRGFLWYIIWVLGGQDLYFSWFWWLMVDIHIDTILGTNISPPKGTFESMIFLFPRRDYVSYLEGTLLVC